MPVSCTHRRSRGSLSSDVAVLSGGTLVRREASFLEIQTRLLQIQKVKCVGNSYGGTGGSHHSSLAGLSTLTLQTEETTAVTHTHTTTLLRSLEFKPSGLRGATYSGSLGSGESHDSGLSSGTNRARGSGAAILSSGTLLY